MTAEFALSLAFTLILEGAVGILAGFRGKDLLLLALVNILTNPVVVLLHAMFPKPVITAILELAAIAVEGAIYSRLGTKIPHPWRFSLEANVFSYVCGIIINNFI